jgi:hypothetical protein
MITITEITGISTLSGDVKKQLVYFNAIVGEITYNWKAYTPFLCGDALLQYLIDSSATYEADIVTKEAIWLTCPKEKEIVGPGGEITIVPVTKDEIVFPTLETVVDRFDSKLFFGRIIQELSVERWFVLSKLGIGWTFEQLTNYPNFPGLKIYMSSLLADETLTQSDVDKITAVLLEQDIIIGDF